MRWASVSDTESKIIAEEVVGTHLCRILDSVSPLPRPETSSVRHTNFTTGGVHEKPQKLCTYFYWYVSVMLLVLRNFKVKIMSWLLFVIFGLLYSFLSTYLMWLWQSQAKRQRGSQDLLGS